ncbi:MAG TPA: glycosyltransferase family 4 protein [Solirubrobacteraceae bacterium]|nr:glycosyltransferase family 4 protein [Solirubrobacteraceae bacterium]
MTARATAGSGDGRPSLLLLTPDYPPEHGGIQLMSRRLAESIDRFDVRVVALGGPAARELDRERPVSVRRVGGAGAPRAARNALLNAVAFGEALRRRPRAALAMHIALAPALAAVGRVLGSETAIIFHAEEITARPALAAFAARRAAASIAVSSYTASLIAATGATPARLRLIAPGVDIPHETAPLPWERPVILTVARLEERYKGHDTMIAALPLLLAKVPDALWVVIGEGSLRPALERMAAGNGVAHAIRFLGAVADDERDLWLRRTSVLAMPSRLPAGGLAGEGFGIVYLEPGAFGKPVLAGDAGGARDSVLDGETGLRVDPRDPLAVAEGLTRLLLDPELARRLGQGGARRAQELTWPLFAARVQETMLEGLERG